MTQAPRRSSPNLFDAENRSTATVDARLIHGDLRLTSAEWSDLTAQGKLDRVVVINQFGTFEQIPHAAGNPRVTKWDKKLEAERKPFLEQPGEPTSSLLIPRN